MEKYLKNVYNIYKNFQEKEDLYPGPRLTPMDNENPKYLILGINPNNSFKAHAKFSKYADDRLQIIKHLKQKSDSEAQKGFDKFLSFDKYDYYKDKTIYLQKLAHKHHQHFIGHADFANQLGINNEDYSFFDLFPIWQRTQKDLNKNLIKKHPVLTRELIDEFNDFLNRKESIKGLLFFNKEAYNAFSKHQTSLIKNQNETKISLKTRKPVSVVVESSIRINDKMEVEITAFGIGDYAFRKKQMTELASHFKHRFN
ncbi:MAG: hypothetical protein OXC61_10660 [Flavobacteriaceae bacterium]|nr:hypothetical protein [Flavobacteriaceae bacterium]